MIYAYGLFWRADEVDWHPGNGRPFRLLGYHRGAKRNLRIVDFKVQSGIYILYGNHGAYYVGLTKNWEQDYTIILMMSTRVIGTNLAGSDLGTSLEARTKMG